MSEAVDTPATIWTDRFIKRELLPAGELARRFNILNPRSHPEAQREATESSLDTVGWIDEISLSTNGPGPASLADNPDAVMFDGHERVELVLVRGGEAALLPVKWYQLTPKETDFALLVKDPTTEMAETKPKELAALLERTRTMTVDPRLGAMLERLRVEAGINGNGSAPPEAPPMVDRAEADRLAKEYGVETGQVWALGRHRLVVSDSTTEATRKEFIKGDEYLFTDPPYGIGVDTSWLSALNVQRGKPANLSDDKLHGDDGTLDLSFLFGFERRFIWGFPYIYDPDATGWIVWDKQPGVSERGIVTPVELASTTLRKGFDMVRLMWGGFYRAAGEERHPHPTQKPMGVFLPFIEDWTKEGDKVVDPFLGSGTTLLCCEKLGRICTGFDIHPPYVAVTISRWETLTGQKAQLTGHKPLAVPLGETPRRAAL